MHAQQPRNLLAMHTGCFPCSYRLLQAAFPVAASNQRNLCRWISLLGATMSACYATIAFAASVLHEEPDTGVSYDIRPGSTADQAFGALNALGTIMFAFGGHAILLEIQVGPSVNERNGHQHALAC